MLLLQTGEIIKNIWNAVFMPVKEASTKMGSFNRC